MANKEPEYLDSQSEAAENSDEKPGNFFLNYIGVISAGYKTGREQADYLERTQGTMYAGAVATTIPIGGILGKTNILNGDNGDQKNTDADEDDTQEDVEMDGVEAELESEE